MIQVNFRYSRCAGVYVLQRPTALSKRTSILKFKEILKRYVELRIQIDLAVCNGRDSAMHCNSLVSLFTLCTIKSSVKSSFVKVDQFLCALRCELDKMMSKRRHFGKGWWRRIGGTVVLNLAFPPCKDIVLADISRKSKQIGEPYKQLYTSFFVPLGPHGRPSG